MFYNDSCFITFKSTFVQSIKLNDLTSWPSLTEDLVSKYMPKTEATAKGQIKKIFKGTKYTQPKQLQLKAPFEVTTQRTHNFF